jgi:methylated-DNA-protein-cysteine methyltransferase related protein
MSDFKKNVIRAVNSVPSGSVVSYGQIALMVGIPRAARQVGWVLHEYGEKTPWWRVINNAGRISTNCEEHTADMQRSLLISEGIAVSESLKIDIEKYRYRPEIKSLRKFNLDPKYMDTIVDKYLI